MEKVTDFNGEDITSLKIYLDNKGNYRHRYMCSNEKCKNPSICMCYPSLFSAVTEVKECTKNFVCSRHYLLWVISDETLEYAYKFQEILPKNSLILTKVNTLLDKISASEVFLDIFYEELPDLCEEVVLHHLTEEQVSKFNSEYDFDPEYNYLGESCST